MSCGKRLRGMRSMLNSVRETNALLESKTPPVSVKVAKHTSVTYKVWNKLIPLIKSIN